MSKAHNHGDLPASRTSSSNEKVAVVTTQSLPCTRGHEESELIAVKKEEKYGFGFTSVQRSTIVEHICVRTLILF